MPKFLFLILAIVPVCAVQGGCGDATSPVCEHTLELPPRNAARVSVTQGLWGDVWFWEGDFMPTCPSGSVTAVGREMRIHERASLSDVVPAGLPFFLQVNTSLVATVWSDSDGFFQAALPHGQYSVFSVEDSLLYANRFDGLGHIFPVEVKDGEVTGVTFDITYRAYE